MDNQSTNQSLFTLRINENLKTQLRGAAVVAAIAAILSLARWILSFVMAIMNKNKTALEDRFEGFNQTTESAEQAGNIIGGVITLVVSLLLFYFLNKFASKTKTGLNANNPQIINSGLAGLSAYLVTLGILLIICLALFLLVLMVAPTGA